MCGVQCVLAAAIRRGSLMVIWRRGARSATFEVLCKIGMLCAAYSEAPERNITNEAYIAQYFRNVNRQKA